MPSRSISNQGINNLNGTFQVIPVNMATPFANFTGFVSLVKIQGSDWDGTASTLTMAITEDLAGDQLIITDTESTLFAGKTTATTCGCEYRIDSIIATATNYLYLWFKTDSGTIDIDKLIITLRDD